MDAGDDAGGGTDGGRKLDGGLGLCATCGLEVCEEGLDCRLVGGGFGYCARFLPTCPGLRPDIAAVSLEYGRPCRTEGVACTIRARLELSDAGLVVRRESFFADGGLLDSAARDSASQAVALWQPLAVGCYPSGFVFPDDSCLTHSDYFVLRFDLNDGGAAGVEFSGGSSTQPSRPFIAAVVALAQAAESALDGGP